MTLKQTNKQNKKKKSKTFKKLDTKKKFNLFSKNQKKKNSLSSHLNLKNETESNIEKKNPKRQTKYLSIFRLFRLTYLRE